MIGCLWSYKYLCQIFVSDKEFARRYLQVRRRVHLGVNGNQSQGGQMVANITQSKEVVLQGEPMDEKTNSSNKQEEKLMDASIALSKAILLENVDYQ